MIPNNFIYCKPDILEEVPELYNKYKSEGKKVKFYSGGSEIITMARASTNEIDVVIDLKSIQEMQEIKMLGDKLNIGACVTLNRIKDSKIFPLLRNYCRKNCRSYKSK